VYGVDKSWRLASSSDNLAPLIEYLSSVYARNSRNGIGLFGTTCLLLADGPALPAYPGAPCTAAHTQIGPVVSYGSQSLNYFVNSNCSSSSSLSSSGGGGVGSGGSSASFGALPLLIRFRPSNHYGNFKIRLRVLFFSQHNNLQKEPRLGVALNMLRGFDLSFDHFVLEDPKTGACVLPSVVLSLMDSAESEMKYASILTTSFAMLNNTGWDCFGLVLPFLDQYRRASKVRLVSLYTPLASASPPPAGSSAARLLSLSVGAPSFAPFVARFDPSARFFVGWSKVSPSFIVDSANASVIPEPHSFTSPSPYGSVPLANQRPLLSPSPSSPAYLSSLPVSSLSSPSASSPFSSQQTIYEPLMRFSSSSSAFAPAVSASDRFASVVFHSPMGYDELHFFFDVTASHLFSYVLGPVWMRWLLTHGIGFADTLDRFSSLSPLYFNLLPQPFPAYFRILFNAQIENTMRYSSLWEGLSPAQPPYRLSALDISDHYQFFVDSNVETLDWNDEVFPLYSDAFFEYTLSMGGNSLTPPLSPVFNSYPNMYSNGGLNHTVWDGLLFCPCHSSHSLLFPLSCAGSV
jgi:hypothetical protein